MKEETQLRFIKMRQVLTILLLGTLLFGGFSCVAGNVKSAPETTTTIILIRHAEKRQQVHDGSYLLPEGQARARALVDVGTTMGITAIYSPKLGRNLETVQPLADELGLEITVKEGLNMFGVDEVADEILSTHPGGVVLFVGNVSGNLMAMHAYLGGKGKGPVNYGDMAIFKISDQGTESVTYSRFGD
jgi:hypothetical protein